MMNLYRVISEPLGVVDVTLDDGTGPTEYHHIAHLVAAEYPIDAEVIAWKTDDRQARRLGTGAGSFTGYRDDMPRFDVTQVETGLDIEPGIYSRVERFSHHWDEAIESEAISNA